MIDLHCHLLPAIDDGPRSLEESVALCRLAVEDGITHAVTTPHLHPGRWDNDIATITSRVSELRAELERQRVDLPIGFAAEVRLSDQIIPMLEQGKIPFLGEIDEQRVMLLEFAHGHIVPGSENLVSWLIQRDIRPLIAHPERNRQVMGDPAALDPLLQRGCWLQVTAGSILGRFGQPAQGLARQLLNGDHVAVVSSDAHNTGARAPCMRLAYESVARDYGESRAQRLLCDTPQAIARQQFHHQAEFNTMSDQKNTNN